MIKHMILHGDHCMNSSCKQTLQSLLSKNNILNMWPAKLLVHVDLYQLLEMVN